MPLSSLHTRKSRWLLTLLLLHAEALREAVDVPMAPNDREDYERGVARARAGLEAASWARAWEEGRAMPLEQALHGALHGFSKPENGVEE